MSDQRFDVVVDAILSGKAPDKIRSAAARGALPLPPPTLARLYIHLQKDRDESIQADAAASLAALEGSALYNVLDDPVCPPEVMLHFAKPATRDTLLAERIAFHPKVPQTALIVLAQGGSGKIIDLVLTNQERILAQPALLDYLMLNAALQPDQRGRILDILERIAMAQERAANAEDTEDTPEDSEDAYREAARILEVDVGELLMASEIVDGEEFAASDDAVVRDAYRKILTLNTSQKAILAMKGGREERGILVRDSNRTVALGVLRNPRITDVEAERIAQMRNVSGDVLRTVGSNRNWSKSYVIIHSLIKNPRTPPATSTNFIPRLTTKDLQKVLTSRDVPDLIRRMAKRTVATRQQANANKLRKK